MKVGVISLGCAKNLVDTEYLLGLLDSAGVEVVQKMADAEAVIINTCGFIESAKTEAIDTIFEAASYKEQGLKKLIVMGCLAQRYKPQLEEEIPEADCIISIDEYGRLGDILGSQLGVRIPNTYGKTQRRLSGKPWMAYLKIADGCDNKCSYCAIPLIRGPFRSMDEDALVEEARRLVKHGVKELSLIAQDSSRYGYDLDGKLHLSSLLRRLNAIEGAAWIRVLYLYPDEIPDDLIETMKTCEHVLPYFDIPTQHGSSRMLKAMNRRGSRELIRERCARIRRELPKAVLRTTLITGFPGETEQDHADNLSLLKEIRWDHLGVFTYSSEEDTPAYDLADDIPFEEKERRRRELMAAQAEIVEEENRKRIGMVDTVMVESVDPLTGMYIGRSYMHAPDDVDGSVRFRSDKAHQAGDFVSVRYRKAIGMRLIGDEI
ncbi:MAG: 30S ribosomal protein S12 methylthiotransferase RimO [Solobacterium sp.]|nr:30S ribosomal protein S12 methylthiotransferase RimO [Solobacterium sp.]